MRSEPEAARSFQRTLRETPTLRGRWLEEQRRNRDRLAEALVPWFPSESSSLVAHLAAGIALVVVDEVMALWADESSEPDPLDLLDEAFDALGGSLLSRLSSEKPAISKASLPWRIGRSSSLLTIRSSSSSQSLTQIEEPSESGGAAERCAHGIERVGVCITSSYSMGCPRNGICRLSLGWTIHSWAVEFGV